MNLLLKMAINMALNVVFPIVREYVKKTQTQLDDAALDIIEKLLRDNGFLAFAKANPQLMREVD